MPLFAMCEAWHAQWVQYMLVERGEAVTNHGTGTSVNTC